MRHAGRPTPAKLRCWRRATVTGSSLVPQMRGWVDGRMQWPVSQHRGVIEPPAVVVWRKRRSSLSRPWTAVFRCPYFAFRVGSSFRRGCALSVCCGGGLCLPRRSGRAEPLPFSVFPNGRRDGDWCVSRASIFCSQRRPGICPPPPAASPPRCGAVVVFLERTLVAGIALHLSQTYDEVRVVRMGYLQRGSRVGRVTCVKEAGGNSWTAPTARRSSTE